MDGTDFYVPRLSSWVVILLFVLMSATIADRSLHLDNEDFMAAATSVASTGKPIFYRGEQDPKELALWHPPLYLYLLGGWLKVFGVGVAQARTFGVLCAILQGWIVLVIVATLFGPAARSMIEPWFWAMYLLNPFTVQTATVLDIDSTIYGPLLCGVLLATLRMNWRDGEQRKEPPSGWDYVWVGGAIALALWAKLTTILLVIPFVFLLLWRPWGFWRAARFTILAGASGLAAFLLTFYAYGAVVHLDVKYTFNFLVYSFLSRMSRGADHTGLAARLADMRSNARSMIPFEIRWIGLLPWLGLAGGIFGSAWIALRTRSLRAWDYFLVMLLVAATTVYYCFQTMTWADSPFKYVFVFWGLTIVATLLLAFNGELWTSHPVPAKSPGLWSTGTVLKIACAAVFLIAAWLGHNRLQDHQLREWRTSYWAALPPAMLLLPAITGAFWTRKVLGFSRAALLLGICGWMGLQFGIAAYQIAAPYTTTYNYGQTGMEETAAFLRFNVAKDELFSSMKDLGYLTHRRYYDNYQVIFGGPAYTAPFIEAMKTGRIKLAAFTEGRGQDDLSNNPALKEWVLQHCRLIHSFGDYRIYQLASP